LNKQIWSKAVLEILKEDSEMIVQHSSAINELLLNEIADRKFNQTDAEIIHIGCWLSLIGKQFDTLAQGYNMGIEDIELLLNEFTEQFLEYMKLRNALKDEG
jgi:hypothetical protein